MIIDILLIILGFFLLVVGADILVDGAGSIAKKFKIPVIIIGLTIVAIGTSMPELVVSTTSAIKGHSDIAVGNVLGSNISNLLFILGLCAIIKPLQFKKQTKYIENFIAIFSTIILCFFCMNLHMSNTSMLAVDAIGTVNQITRVEGIVLLICFIAFIGYTIFISFKVKDNEESSIKEQSLLKSCGFILLGVLALKFGGDLVVESASKIAKTIGITERLISLTIVAFSTSLPELITSINAVRKGETDMAIGNIIGSGIFNIFLILGLSAAITPINYDTNYNYDLFLLLFSTIIFALFPFIGKKDTMSQFEGIVFVVAYVYYVMHLIVS